MVSFAPEVRWCSIVTHLHDAVGNVILITDPAGNETCYEYDDAGRVIAVGDPIFYQYDAADQVVGITDRNGRQRDFTYNDLGLMTSEGSLDTLTTGPSSRTERDIRECVTITR
jgi:YD repeat-containing protein